MNSLNAESMDQTSQRKNNFHIIRYILAVLVVYSHSYGLLAKPEPGIFQFTYGSFAVKCFFALSGYLITLSCLRSKNLFSYFRNRVLRIAPAFLIAFIFSPWLGGIFNQFSDNPVPYILNGPIWTLPWEFFCYILCGMIWWLGFLSKETLAPVVIVSWLLYILLPHTGETGIVIAPLMLMFFTGSLIALNEKNFKLQLSGPIFALIIISIIFDTKMLALTWVFKLIPFLYGPLLPIQEYYFYAFLLCLPFSCIWLGLYVKPIVSLKNDYSYGIYIYHWPIMQALVALFHPAPLLLFITTLAGTHLLAMFSWHLVEKRALMIKHLPKKLMFGLIK